MSIQFNDTSTYKGAVQIYEREVGFNRGDVSGNAERLAQFTADYNIALDDFLFLALRSSGTWQFDDSNQTDHPIIKTNLVANQKDYSFTTDGSSNLILDIHKVAILPSATATLYIEIPPVDVQSEDLPNLVGQSTVAAVPYQYDKTGNSIFLDSPPSYNATNGLLVYISREGSYMTSSDTTKKPGIPGLFHKYPILKAAQEDARRRTLASYDRLTQTVNSLESRIEDYFGNRERDKRKVMSMKLKLYV